MDRGYRETAAVGGLYLYVLCTEYSAFCQAARNLQWSRSKEWLALFCLYIKAFNISTVLRIKRYKIRSTTEYFGRELPETELMLSMRCY